MGMLGFYSHVLHSDPHKGEWPGHSLTFEPLTSVFDEMLTTSFPARLSSACAGRCRVAYLHQSEEKKATLLFIYCFLMDLNAG